MARQTAWGGAHQSPGPGRAHGSSPRFAGPSCFWPRKPAPHGRRLPCAGAIGQTVCLSTCHASFPVRGGSPICSHAGSRAARMPPRSIAWAQMRPACFSGLEARLRRGWRRPHTQSADSSNTFQNKGKTTSQTVHALSTRRLCLGLQPFSGPACPDRSLPSDGWPASRLRARPPQPPRRWPTGPPLSWSGLQPRRFYRHKSPPTEAR